MRLIFEIHPPGWFEKVMIGALDFAVKPFLTHFKHSKDPFKFYLGVFWKKFCVPQFSL